MDFLRSSTLKKENLEGASLRVDCVYIEKSFDTIFNMGYASGKSPLGERVNSKYYFWGFFTFMTSQIEKLKDWKLEEK